MRDLAPCPGCRRLLRQRDATCPFCFAKRVVAFAAILPFSVACQKAAPAGADSGAAASASATTTTSATAAASDTVPPLPALSASATPSAIASARQAAIGRDAGNADQGVLAALSGDAGALASLFGGDAGLGGINTPGIGAYGGAPSPTLGPGIGPGIGAYGGAPSPGLGGLASGNVTTSMSGAHTTTDDRAVAGRRGLMRACYTKGLIANPDMSGKLKLHVTVGSDGSGAATVTSATGSVAPDVQQCIAASITRGATFEANPHAFDVDVTLSK